MSGRGSANSPQLDLFRAVDEGIVTVSEPPRPEPETSQALERVVVEPELVGVKPITDLRDIDGGIQGVLGQLARIEQSLSEGTYPLVLYAVAVSQRRDRELTGSGDAYLLIAGQTSEGSTRPSTGLVMPTTFKVRNPGAEAHVRARLVDLSRPIYQNLGLGAESQEARQVELSDRSCSSPPYTIFHEGSGLLVMATPLLLKGRSPEPNGGNDYNFAVRFEEIDPALQAYRHKEGKKFYAASGD